MIEEGRARGEAREERPQSPQLALRVAILGGVAVIAFAVLFFRLWVLQVLSAQQYQSVAAASRLRTIDEPAERGMVVDRNGVPLIRNRPGNAIALDLSTYPTIVRLCGARRLGPPDLRSAARVRVARAKALRSLPRAVRVRRAAELRRAATRPAPRIWAGCATRAATDPDQRSGDGARAARVLRQLSTLTGTTVPAFEDALHAGIVRSPFEPAELVQDVSRDVLFYVKEHAAELPGVRVVKRTVREYPQGPVGSLIVGGLTEISQKQLEDTETYPDAKAGDVVGSGGVEQAFDRFLRGRDGELGLEVGADGTPRGSIKIRREAQPGNNVVLTLDLRLQRAAEAALARGIDRAQAAGFRDAQAGAVVALDPKTGAVLALASYPTFDPNRLAGPNGSAYFRAIQEQVDRGDVQTPFIDRATTGLYPPGSTFKPVTATAAIMSGLTTTDRQIDCPSQITIDKTKYRNFESEAEGPIALPRALEISCNTYFYQLGKLLYDATPNAPKAAQPQPEWARRFGFGQPTGLELPSADGVVPDIAYKKRYADTLVAEHVYKKGSIQYLIDRTWNSGDAIGQAIGQGQLLVTPLQVAVLYAAIANGGTVVSPHVGQEVDRPDGGVLRVLGEEPRRRLDIDPYLLQTIRSGLGLVVGQPDGTAYDAFKGLGVSVAGKTGTAEQAGKRDYAWFAGYAPATGEKAPEIVVVALVEQGGRGGEVAAPIVAQVMARYFDRKAPPPPDITSPTQQGAQAAAAAAAQGATG